MKKLMCLLLVVAMLLSFMACAKNEGEKTSGDVTTMAPEVNPFEEFFEISWLVQYTKNYEEGRWDELELEEKFNVDLKVWNTDYDNAEELTLMISAGNVPDMGFYPKDPIELYEQGLTRTINMNMIKTYLPGYYEIIEEYPIGLKFNAVPDTENEYYGITMASALSKFYYSNHAIRLDWLENIGYTLDDLTPFKTPDVFNQYGNFENAVYFSNRMFTYDEFLDINKSFTEDDPDGNGEDDTYFGISLGIHTWNRLTLATFGIHIDGNSLYKDNLTGDVVPYYAYEGYRDFLIWETDALEKGYIRKLPGADTWLNELYAAWASRKHGYYELSSQDVLAEYKPDFSMSLAPGSVLKEDPDATFVIFPGFTGPAGYGGNTRYSPTPYRGGGWGTWKIGKEVTDDKLARILQMMEYTHFDKDAYLRYWYGIEGIHYKWLGEPGKSSILSTPADQLPAEYASGAPVNIFASNKFLMDMSIWSLFSSYYYTWHFYQEENGWGKYDVEPYKYVDRMYFTQELYEKYDKTNQEVKDSLSAVRSEFWNNAHEGQIAEIHNEWSSYLERLYSNGLDKLVEIFNSDEMGLFLK
ncbi:MAG TPA: hypothetical protein DDZ89_04780 [Clostridiales bacterium]|nr:hypothetical protein [Clostridiales bacterium]